MANALYKKYKQACVEGSGHASYVAFIADTIKIMLVTSGYTPDMTADQFVGNGTTPIATAQIVARSSALTTKATTNGTVSADNVTFSSVSGSAAKAIVMYKDSGSDATSALMAYIDTGTGLPVTPNGGDIIVAWDTGTNKIYTI